MSSAVNLYTNNSAINYRNINSSNGNEMLGYGSIILIIGIVCWLILTMTEVAVYDKDLFLRAAFGALVGTPLGLGFFCIGLHDEYEKYATRKQIRERALLPVHNPPQTVTTPLDRNAPAG